MIESLLGIAVLLLLSGLFVFLFLRSIRPRRSFLKWVGAVLSGILALAFAALTIVGARGVSMLYLPRNPAVAEFTVEGTPQQIERGAHLVSVVCADCHSKDRSLPLSGGLDLMEGSPIPLGSMPAYNLTPAGPIKDWSDADLYRAIRFNVDPDGRRLAAMSFTGVGNLSDEDTHAVIAYLRSQPAVGDETRQEKLNIVATLMTGAGLFPLQERADKVAAVTPGATAEYGKYMANYLSCQDCHGADLDGGGGGLGPAGPSLVNSVPTWTTEQFKTAIRTGVRPFGPKLDPNQMPWPIYANMDDTELAAVHAYISSLQK